uniref:Uncharacterized protein n=1 Tax=Peronospora matthiolae TaxID=2874970 RepID=A0AAV1UMW3_9STRA
MVAAELLLRAMTSMKAIYIVVCSCLQEAQRLSKKGLSMSAHGFLAKVAVDGVVTAG